MNRHMKLLSGLLLLAVLPLAANADEPGKHPGYLHALTDLRAARWMLQHKPGGPATIQAESVAIGEIEAAIHEIKAAAIDDGKSLDDHPPLDAPADQRALLHSAHDLLLQVHHDVAQEEDDPYTRELRNRAVGHIDAAIHATETALHDRGY